MSDNATPPPPPPPGSGQGGGYGAPPPPGQGGGYGAPPPAPSYEAGVQGTPPPNYLVWAILATIFCCLPPGIAAIVFAAQVNGKFRAGDVAGAQASSAKAKQWTIITAIVGVVWGIIYFLLIYPNMKSAAGV